MPATHPGGLSLTLKCALLVPGAVGELEVMNVRGIQFCTRATPHAASGILTRGVSDPGGTGRDEGGQLFARVP